MDRCLVTHSLLYSWVRCISPNPYESMDSVDPMEDMLTVLRREPTEPTQAMQNGIEFEDLVTDIVMGRADPEHKWFLAAGNVASRVKGGALQCKAAKPIEVDGVPLLLYGRLDCLKAGEIIDIKFSGVYERGKYLHFTQHPVYMELIPEAKQFTYVVSNGTNVWTETYRRDETRSVYPIIRNFLNWLDAMGLMEVYKEHWGSRK